MTLGVRAVHRTLRAAIGSGFNPTASKPFRLGNPGRGELSFLPAATRRYRALELTLQRSFGKKLGFTLAYVFSRSRGTYAGLYNSDQRAANPNNYFSLQLAEQAVNSTGPLPNDRPHVLKLVANYRATPTVALGTYFTVMSGTPLNQLGASYLIYRPIFLVQRGSAGRTPTLWDLNLRVSWELQRLLGARAGLELRLVADLLHVGNPQKAVDYDQVRFLAVDADGNQINPNPNYGQVLRYQDPTALRLGLEVGF